MIAVHDVFDGRVLVAINKIRNHLDGPRDAKVLERFFLQVVGDAGDAVALLNGEAGDGQVAAVQAHQRNVGAVQRGDKGQPDAARGQHLTRQQSTDRVGNRVMHMQQVQIVELGHFRHS